MLKKSDKTSTLLVMILLQWKQIQSKEIISTHFLELKSIRPKVEFLENISTAQWLNILGEGTNNSYTINELSCCNFLVLDVIFWD